MRSKFVSLGAAVMALALVLSGCQAASSSKESILTRVLSDKTLKVGVIDANPPWSQLGADGKPAGYDIDIAKAIAETLGATPQVTVVDLAGRVTALQTGQLDLVVSQFTRTPQRAVTIAFTPGYVVVRGQFMVKADSPYQTWADINKPNVRCAIARGGTSEQLVPAAVPNCKIVAFNAQGDTLQAVNAGQADVMAQGDTFYNAAVMAKQPGVYRVLPGFYSAETISIAMPQGDSTWARFLDTWVVEFNNSGQNAALFTKWFGFDLPALPGGQ